MNLQYKIDKQFYDTLRREGQSITDYFADVQYQVFFKSKKSDDISAEQVRIYYAKDCGIAVGTVFTYQSKQYIVINQDSAESNIFATSIATQATQKLLCGGKYIPFAVGELQDVNPDGTSTISTVDGSIAVYTGDNEYFRAVSVNNTYVAFGGTYKVINTFYNNNIGYLYLTRTANAPVDYSVRYDGLTDFSMDAPVQQLDFKACENNMEIPNVVLDYSSSDTTIATVDTKGIVTFLTAGIVDIAATWTEHSVSETATLTVTAADTQSMTCNITYSGTAELKIGSRDKTFTHHFYDGTGIELMDIIPVWTVESGEFDVSKLTVSYSTTNAIKIKIADDYLDYVGYAFTLTLTDADNTCIDNLTVTIAE